MATGNHLLVSALLCFALLKLGYAQTVNNEQLMCADTSCDDTSCVFAGKVHVDCRCGSLCELYGDCCMHREACFATKNSMAQKDQKHPHFQCHTPVPRQPWTLDDPLTIDPQNYYWYWMVLDCPTDWLSKGDSSGAELRQSIQYMCENNTVNLPVSDRATGFDYRNEHCALCNGVELQDILHWGYNYSCRIVNEIAQNDSNFVFTQYDIDNFCKFINFSRPVFTIKTTGLTSMFPRYCYPSQPLTCLNQTTLEDRTGLKRTTGEYNALKLNCEEGNIQAFIQSKTANYVDYPYRNGYCAFCNGYKESDLWCYIIAASGQGEWGYSFSVLLDIHQDGQLVLSSDVINTKTNFACPKNEVYDPLLKACRRTILLDCLNRTGDMYFVLEEASCEKISCSGSLVILNNSIIFPQNDTNRVIYGGHMYEIEFNTTDGEPVVCVNFSANGTQMLNNTLYTYTYPLGYYVLTYIGCSLSVIGCILVLITNSIFKELRSLSSKLLMNLAFAILVTNLLIILGGPITSAFPENEDLCVSTAILLHFFSLSQFSWMCVMGTEVVHSFYNAHKMRPKDHFPRHRKLLAFYIITGWSIPLIITIVTIIVNFSTDNLVLYGVTEDGTVGSCWINHFESMILAFIIPVVISLTFNAIAFIIVCILLIQGRCLQHKLKTEKQFPYFRASIAIFTVSGLTWTFGFVAVLSRSLWSWYPFIILNSLQGLLIFIAFLCTKKVGKLYLSLLTRNKAHRQLVTQRATSIQL